MIRCETYIECTNCIWYANPDKCNEYQSCRECPNDSGKDCACCEEIPEGEQTCPYFKLKYEK